MKLWARAAQALHQFRSRTAFDGLFVITRSVIIADVLVRGLFEMVFDVRESVLSHVCETATWVPLALALVEVGHILTDEQLDEGKLASTVGSEKSHTRGQGHLHIQ